MKPVKFWLGAVMMALAVFVGACSAGGGTSTGNEAKTLTVWLMNGSAPDSVVQGVHADFKAKHPNVTDNVEIQQWSDATTKLDTALAGSAPPDPMAPGNTPGAKYASPGALADLATK